MSYDNKCEGFSNLNCFSIISKFKSLFGSKLIEAGDFGKDNKFAALMRTLSELSDSLTSSPSAFAFGSGLISSAFFGTFLSLSLGRSCSSIAKTFWDSLRS
jgi:hypothetical protein